MASLESMFIIQSPYQKDKDDFIEFIKNNASEVFPANLNTNYKVPYLYVRSVLNPNGKMRKKLLEIEDILKMKQANSDYDSMHKDQILYMLHKESKGSIQIFNNKMKKVIREVYRTDIQFNKVKYGYEDNYLRKGRFIK